MNSGLRFAGGPAGIRRRLLLMLAASIAAAPLAFGDDPFCYTISRGGLVTPDTNPAQYRDILIIGQPLVGAVGAATPGANNEFAHAALGLGFVLSPCISDLTFDLTITDVYWVGGNGFYSIANNWSPAVTPNNGSPPNYSVHILAGVNPIVTLDMSPTISRLEIGPGATLQLSDAAPVSRNINFDPPGLPAEVDNATNAGLLQINMSSVRDLELKNMHLTQTTGIVRATGSVQCSLTLTRCRITGGAVEATGQARLYLYDTTIVGGNIQGSAPLSIGNSGNETRATLQNAGTTPISNSATISVAAGSSVKTTSVGVTLTGGGALLLNSSPIVNSEIGGIEGVITNGASVGTTHRVEGAGTIVGRLLNRSVVSANVPDQALNIDIPSFFPGAETEDGPDFVNKHLLLATGGGILNVFSDVGNDGIIRAETGSTLNIYGAIQGGLLVGAGGIINVVGTGVLADEVEISPGSVSHLNVSSGRLEASGSAGITIDGGVATLDSQSVLRASNGPLTVGPQIPGATAQLVVHSGARVEAKSMTFNNTDPTDFTWEVGSVLNITGGTQPGSGTTLEIGGVDRGADPSGWIDNFQLDTLEIGPGACVSLVNQNDNSGSPLEALYVRELRFSDQSARLNTNGLPFYYVSLSGGDASQIVNFPGGQGCASCPGDIDGDSTVALTDLTTLLSHFGVPSGASLPDGDLDADGDVDLTDLTMLLSHFGSIC